MRRALVKAVATRFRMKIGDVNNVSQQAKELVPEALARTWLDRFFPDQPLQGSASEDPTDWQKLACAVALRAHLSVITGGPGTGKTYTAARLLAVLLALHEGGGGTRPSPFTLP